jgi:hypothetical protein
MLKKGIFLIFVLISLAVIVKGETIVSSCQTLSVDGETYIVKSFSENNANGICLDITGDNILVEGNDSTVTNLNVVGARVGIRFNSVSNVTVQNLTFVREILTITSSSQSSIIDSSFQADGGLAPTITNSSYLYLKGVTLQSAVVTAFPFSWVNVDNSIMRDSSVSGFYIPLSVDSNSDNVSIISTSFTGTTTTGGITFSGTNSYLYRNTFTNPSALTSASFSALGLLLDGNTFTNIGNFVSFGTGTYNHNSISQTSTFGSSIVGHGTLTISSNAIVNNVTVRGQGTSAIAFTGSNSVVTNATINMQSSGFVHDRNAIFFYGGENNQLNNFVLTASVDDGLVFQGTSVSDLASGNVIRNGVISATNNDVEISGFTSGNRIVNITYSDAESNSGTDNSNNQRLWYYRARVQNYTSANLQNVLINDTRSDGVSLWGALTDSLGYISPQESLSYSISDTTYTYYNNHTFIARGLSGGSQEFLTISHNVTSEGNIYSDVFVFLTGEFTPFIPEPEGQQTIGVEGGLDLPTELVNIDNEEQGLLPEIYRGSLAFFSATLIPFVTIMFVVFFCLMILALFTFIKKIASKF